MSIKSPVRKVIDKPVMDKDNNYRDYEHVCGKCGYKNIGRRTRCNNCNTEINTVI